MASVSWIRTSCNSRQQDCVLHFAAFKASAKADARILLTKPVARADRRTRTWLLNPDEIDTLAYQLAVEQNDD